MHSLTDEQVMVEYQKGEAAAMDELLRRYKHPVFNFCFRLLGNYHEAEETAQEVFLRIHVHKGTYEPERKFTTWMFAIAHHICISVVRKRKWTISWPRKKEDADAFVERPSDTPSPQAEAESREINKVIHQCIKKLPFLQKEALILREFYRLSYREIADAMGQPLNSVKSLVFRAREELKSKLLAALKEAEGGQS